MLKLNFFLALFLTGCAISRAPEKATESPAPAAPTVTQAEAPDEEETAESGAVGDIIQKAGQPENPEAPVVASVMPPTPPVEPAKPAAAPETTEPPVSRETLPLDETRETSRSGENDLFEKAKLFDRYLHGKLSKEQVSAMRASCRVGKSKNIFCFSIRRGRSLEPRIAAHIRVYRPPTPVPAIPVQVVYKNNKVANWRELRRGRVQNLLKGLLSVSQPELHEIAKRALAERLCPNNVAVATAATLEDYLPDPSLHEEIAKLYEKGAACARREPIDREHFRTRAGLFFFMSGNYDQAARHFARVKAMDAYSGRALYWLYRSRRALGDSAGAAKAYRRLIAQHPFSFHSIIARLTENEDPGEKFLGESSFLRKRSRRSPPTNHLIEQAETLKNFGFDDSATILVDWALDGAFKQEPEVKLYLASLGDSHTRVSALPGLLLRKPKLITRESMELLFPAGFQAACEKHSAGLDPFLLLSIAKKESAFDPKAISTANAQGLLQLAPETAKQMTNGVDVDLLDPETNIDIAARYLSGVITRMEGQLHLAIASYNAGEPPVNAWRKRLPSNDSLLFTDLIPYRETRDYVGFVLSNYYWYRRIYKQGVPEVFKKLIAKKS